MYLIYYVLVAPFLFEKTHTIIWGEMSHYIIDIQHGLNPKPTKNQVLFLPQAKNNYARKGLILTYSWRPVQSCQRFFILKKCEQNCSNENAMFNTFLASI